MEAAKGVNRDLTVRTSVICDRCNGKRAEPGTTHSKCASCNGTGEVSVVASDYGSLHSSL